MSTVNKPLSPPLSFDPIPSPEELVARAAALIPALRERSQRCEQLRRIPPETFDDFRRTGLLRIAQPLRHQGFGYGIDVVTEIAQQIGRGCGSSAWMAGQWPGHQFIAGYFPEQAQQEYWSTDPDTVSSTASAVARLNMEPENGGWRIRDSQMRFSSGCDYAQWILFITQHGICLVPKADFEVLDDWHVAGLRGTGSNSIVIKHAFVPPHRFVPLQQLQTGTTPGANLYPDNPYYRVSFNLVVNQLLLAAAIGMGRGVLDLFEERVTQRKDLHTGKSAAEGAGAQLRFAESAAEIDAAALFIRNNCATLADWGQRGHVPNIPERAEARRNVVYGAKLVVQSSQRLLTAGDASAMFDSVPLGRMGRDIMMAALQANLTWDEPAQTFSRTRWGVEPISYLT